MKIKRPSKYTRLFFSGLVSLFALSRAFLTSSDALEDSGFVQNTYESNNCFEKYLFQAPQEDVFM